MKFLVTTLLLITATATWAQNGSSLGDLLYLQNKGEIIYNNDTTLSYGKYDVSRFDTNGTKLQNLEKKTEKVLMNQTFSYGLSDRLNAGLGVEVAFRDNTKNTMRAYNNGTPIDLEPTIKNPGFGDPYLFSQYRFLTQADNSINVDGLLKITPSVVSAKRGKISGNTASIGDHQNGGHIISAGGQAGKHFGDLEAMLYVNYQLNLKSRIKRVDTAATNTDADLYYYEDMRSICSAGTTFQYRLLQYTFINIGGDVWYNSKSHKETIQRFSGNRFSEDTTNYMSYQLKSELRFVLLQDFYLRLGYAYATSATYETSYNFYTFKQNSETFADTQSHNYLIGFTAKF